MEEKYPGEKYQIRSGSDGEKGVPVRVTRIPAERTDIPAVRFEDMICLEAEKRTLAERVILPLKYPVNKEGEETSTKSGVMFIGHTGTGKTMLAEAVASELDAKFFSVNCSDIGSEWGERCEEKVKDLFAEARKCDRAVILFDEIDSIGGSVREESCQGRAIREILLQKQALEKTSGMFLVITATNAPWNLDESLLRSELFTEKIYLPLPDGKARVLILQKCLEDSVLAPSVQTEYLAERLYEYSCADVKVFCERINVLMARKEFSRQKYPIITEDEVEDILYEARSSALVGEKKLMKEFLESSKQIRLSAWQ
jgi:transitional endoplasmic reticulum ATPase